MVSERENRELLSSAKLLSGEKRMDEAPQQREITRLCIQCALLLLQHGAESMVVEQLSSRLGMALGADSVESSISANSIVLTTIMQGHCLTSTRKNVDRGINMHVVIEVQHAVIMACLLYTSPSPRDLSTSRMPSSA